MSKCDEYSDKIVRWGVVWRVIMIAASFGIGFSQIGAGGDKTGIALVSLCLGIAMLRPEFGRKSGQLVASFYLPAAHAVTNLINRISTAIHAAVVAVIAAKRARKEVVCQACDMVDRRLTQIDYALRVYGGETTVARRMKTLHWAQEQIADVSAQRASGEIPETVLTDKHLQEHAFETYRHAESLGLAQDRLCTELRRLFSDFMPANPLRLFIDRHGWQGAPGESLRAKNQARKEQAPKAYSHD